MCISSHFDFQCDSEYKFLIVSLIDLSPDTNYHQIDYQQITDARQPWYGLRDSLVGFGGRPT